MSFGIEDIYAQQIRPLAADEKLRLVELIAHELASTNGGRPTSGTPDIAERNAARERFRRHAGAVSLGHATGADNQSIDLDLGREYGSESEPA